MRSCILQKLEFHCGLQGYLFAHFVSSKELLYDNHNLSKIHFKQSFHECALIKLQIFKCIWEINPDQELSGLFVCSETGKPFSSLLHRGWIFSHGMSWHSQHTSSAPSPCMAWLFPVPGDDCSPGGWVPLLMGFPGGTGAFPCSGKTAAASHKVCNWLLESVSHHPNSCRLKCCTETQHQHLWQLRRLISIHKESRGA